MADTRHAKSNDRQIKCRLLQIIVRLTPEELLEARSFDQPIISFDALAGPASPSETPSRPGVAPDGTCFGYVDYRYECGPHTNFRNVPIAYDQPGCDDPPSGGVAVFGPSGGGFGGSFGGGGGGPGGGGSTGGGAVGGAPGRKPQPDFRFVPNPAEQTTERCDDGPGEGLPFCLVPIGLGLLGDFTLGAGLKSLNPWFIGAGLALKAAQVGLGGAKPAKAAGDVGGALFQELADIVVDDVAGNDVPGIILGPVAKFGLGAIGGLGNAFDLAAQLRDCLDDGDVNGTDPLRRVASPLAVVQSLDDCGCGSPASPASSPLAPPGDQGAQPANVSATDLADLETQLGTRFDGLLVTEQFAARALTKLDFAWYLLGDGAWFDTSDAAGLAAFLNAVGNLYTTLTPITDATLLPVPVGIAPDLLDAFTARFNRTINNWNSGIFDLSDVPEGESTDFLAFDVLIDLFERAAGPLDASPAVIEQILAYDDELYRDVLEAQVELRIEEQKQIAGVCATVKIRIEQDLVMSRTAFLGTLELAAGVNAIEDVVLDLIVFDALGNVVTTNVFGVANTFLDGISALDGSADLAAQASALAEFTFLPSLLATPDGPASYAIGGRLAYTEGGDRVSINLNPVTVNVLPQAELELTYFQQRGVFGDDPFTDAVEPSLPFILGVQVENVGKGIARDLRIETAQPRIIENEKGLLIDFTIVDAVADTGASTRGLTAIFDDLSPGETKSAHWLLESSLQGKFVEYAARFEHLNDLGLSQLSLVRDVRIIEAIQYGDFDGDGPTDYLTNEIPDLLDAPDALHLSNRSVLPVSVVQANLSVVASSDALIATITPQGHPEGWRYLSVTADISDGFSIDRVLRDDGSVVESDRVWVTDRTFTNAIVRPVVEDRLHLLDDQSSAFYQLVFQPPEDTNSAPTDIVLSNVTVASNRPAGTLVGLLTAVDPDNGDTLTFSFSPSGNTGGFFKIDGNALSTAKSLAFVNGANLSIIIRATDQDGASYDEQFTVGVGGQFVAVPSGGRLAGKSGDDFMSGLAGNDRIVGNSGRDTVDGGDGDDALLGSDGDDSLVGGNGNDLLIGGPGADRLDGGAGTDTLSYLRSVSGVRVMLDAAGNGVGVGGEAEGDAFFGFENVIGSRSADEIAGNSGPNRLLGGNGNDSLEGGGGSDLLRGDGGDDVFVFRATDAPGRVVIADFDASGDDVIRLIGFDDLQGFSDIAPRLRAGSSNTVLVLDQDTRIVFRDTALSTLSPADFLFA